MTFAWDTRKSAANLKKHGVEFREAATIFYDPLSTTFPDEAHSLLETRFITIGISVGGRILVVAGARSATRSETKFYEEN